MEITQIEIEGQPVGLDLEDGLLNIYTGDVLRGQVRIAEPAPLPFEAPAAWTYTDDKIFGFPNGWTLRSGVMHDEDGNVVPSPEDPPPGPIAFAGE